MESKKAVPTLVAVNFICCQRLEWPTHLSLCGVNCHHVSLKPIGVDCLRSSCMQTPKSRHRCSVQRHAVVGTGIAVQTTCTQMAPRTLFHTPEMSPQPGSPCPGHHINATRMPLRNHAGSFAGHGVLMGYYVQQWALLTWHASNPLAAPLTVT